jgi:osmoprotectant transport system permease protein
VEKGASGMTLLAFLDAFTGALEFIFEGQRAGIAGRGTVGGLEQIGDLTLDHVEVSALALAGSLLLALPVGIWLGHRGKGELLAVAIGNAGRAVPELALVAFMVAFVGVGLINLTIALLILGIPPILTNTFVAIRQVDRDAVEAARGMGMSEAGIVARVELPLSVPTLMSGVRTAAIAIVATATIGPIAGVVTLGDLILGRNVYGDDGVLAGAIVVAVLALVIELTLAGVQWMLTPRGVRIQRAPAGA